jgi:hypothetical protein
MRKPYLLALALALLALFFGWRMQQALDAAPSAGDNAARPAATGWQPGAPAPDLPPLPETATAVAAVKDRPLFRADRRPFTEAAAAPTRNFDAELARLSLIGIMAIGDDRKGIVVSKGGTRSERWEVKVGDELPGFHVKEVRTDGLAVTAEEREFLLPLYAGPPTAAGGGAVRTEAVRKEPAPAQPAAAPAPATAQPRSPAVPVQRAGTPSPTPAPPAVQPAPLPTRRAPATSPRYIPGRR